MAKDAVKFTRAVEVRKHDGGVEFLSSELDSHDLSGAPLVSGGALVKMQETPFDPDDPKSREEVKEMPLGQVVSVDEFKGYSPWTHLATVKTPQGTRTYLVH